MTNIAPEQDKKSLNFIEQIVENDLKAGLNDGRIQTPAYRARQSYLYRLRHSSSLRRYLQPAFRRHKSY